MLHCKWSKNNSLSGSDHYPIHINLFDDTDIIPPKTRPKFNLNKANWPLFKEITETLSSNRPPSNNTYKEAANITNILIHGANQTIPQSQQQRKIKLVPWWDPTLQKLKDNKQTAWIKLNSDINTTNIINYKKANAKLKREIKIRKRTSMQNFTSEIHPNTPAVSTA